MEKKNYIVIEKESRHVSYDLSPQVRTNIYGVYDKKSEAIKGLKDCLKIATCDYSFSDTRDVTSTIVEDDDYACAVKVLVDKDSRNNIQYITEMVTISIQEEW